MFTRKDLQTEEGKPSPQEMQANVDKLHIEYEVELIKSGVLAKTGYDYTYIRGYRDENDDLLENIVEKLKTIFPDSLVVLEDHMEDEEMQLSSQVCRVMDYESGPQPCRKYIVVCWANEESHKKVDEDLESLSKDLQKILKREHLLRGQIEKMQLKMIVADDLEILCDDLKDTLWQAMTLREQIEKLKFKIYKKF